LNRAFFFADEPSPKQYGVVPVRAPILVGGFIAADLLFAFSAPESSISHAGHLGGALYGLLYALYLRRRFGRR
jgi:membrane associated rhomboid family serine protease